MQILLIFHTPEFEDKMTLDDATITLLAKRLEDAELTATDITKITDDYPDMDWDDAYAIQAAIRKFKEQRGNKIVGLKMGLTSYAKMAQMGVDSPVMGFLADYFSCADGAAIDMSGLIHPKVEAEVAFVTKHDLRGPGCNIARVMSATDFVVPALEIIDSRYKDFKFDLKSVIADNTSSARFVVGGKQATLQDLSLRTLGVVLEKNGVVTETGAGAAVLGHPANSVAALANMLAERDEMIPAGTFIMTGGITAAVAVSAGDAITVHYQDLGSVSVRFV